MSARLKIRDSVREQKIGFEMNRSQNSPKQITLNGVKQKGARALFDVFKCIAFIPDDVDIIKGSPEKRRSFIDMAASQLNPVSVVHLNKHNAIMNQRNALLKGIMQGSTDRGILDIWDRQAAREGAVISYMRNEYISRTAAEGFADDTCFLKLIHKTAGAIVANREAALEHTRRTLLSHYDDTCSILKQRI